MPSCDPRQNPFAQLRAVAREVSFIEGAELVRQGEASRGAFLIRSGTVEARVAFADKLRVLNDRVREHPAFEDRPITDSAPATDPLANVPRSRLISHARLTAASEKAKELETALHGQMWRAEGSS